MPRRQSGDKLPPDETRKASLVPVHAEEGEFESSTEKIAREEFETGLCGDDRHSRNLSKLGWLVAILVSLMGFLGGFVVYLQSDVSRASAFLNRLATLLPCHVEGTANNAVVAVMKMSNFKSGKSFDNQHDLELFPFWFTKTAEYLGPTLWNDDLMESIADRTNFFRAGLQSDAESGSVKQWVYVGAGFDTPLLKYAEDPKITAQFYELDLPFVSTAKVCLLNRWNAEVAGRFHHLSIDLNKETVSDVLAPGTGFNPTLKTTYIEQFTLPYISPSRRSQIVQSLFKTAASGSNFHLLLFCGTSDHCMSPFEHVGLAGASKYLEALGKDDLCSYSVRTWNTTVPIMHKDEESLLKIGFAEDMVGGPFNQPAGSKWQWGGRQGIISIEKMCRP